MAHAAKPAAASADLRFQHRLDPVAQCQIGGAHDTSGDPRLAVASGGAHRRDAGDELSLADHMHLRWAVRAVHRMAFLEHRRDNVVAGVEIGQQLIEQIAVAVAHPEMMARIDDRQVGVEDRLRLSGRHASSGV